MRNNKKNDRIKVSRRKKHPRSNFNSRRQSSLPQQGADNSTTDPQQSDNGSTGSEVSNNTTDSQRSDNGEADSKADNSTTGPRRGDNGDAETGNNITDLQRSYSRNTGSEVSNNATDAQRSDNGEADSETDDSTADPQRGDNGDVETGNNITNTQRSESGNTGSDIDGDTTDPQRRENGSAVPEINNITLGDDWFRNPLFSKMRLEHVTTTWRNIKNDRRFAAGWFGSFFLFFYPLILTAYCIFGFINEDKHNSMYVAMYGGSIFMAFSFFIRYLNNVNILLSSVFEVGQKSFLGYLADPIITELGLTAFEIEELIRQFVKGGQSRRTFACGICAFSCYLLGNALLLFKSKQPEPVANDSPPEYEMQPLP